jgi:hypothetical protein
LPAASGGIDAAIRVEWRGDFGVNKQKTLRALLTTDADGKLVAVRMNDLP